MVCINRADKKDCMIEPRKISLCVTTFERFDLTIKCFAQILNDERISEIVIVDDCSKDGSYEKLCHYYVKEPKIKIYRNDHNLDCYKNKHRAVQLATNPWVALLDSDNIFDKTYLDAIYAIGDWRAGVIYQPSWATPEFDFRAFENEIIMNGFISSYFDRPMFLTMLNAQNYFFNKETYLGVWDKMEKIDPITSDSIWVNYNWLKSGGWIYVVPNMHYEHLVHAGSHYQKNVHRTGDFSNKVEKMLREL